MGLPRCAVILGLALLFGAPSVADDHKAEGIDKVLIYGASGRIGSRIVDEALRRGYQVTGVTRDAERLAEREAEIIVETGDILDREATRERIRRHDAVIVSVGGPPADKDPANYIAAKAAESLIEVMESIGDDGPRLIFVGNLFTLIYEDGKSLLDLGRIETSHENYAMFYGHEIALARFRQSSGFQWTVATPPNGLRLTGRTGKVRWGGDELVRDEGGAPSEISPEDFAFAIFEELAAGKYINRRFNVGR